MKRSPKCLIRTDLLLADIPKKDRRDIMPGLRVLLSAFERATGTPDSADLLN